MPAAGTGLTILNHTKFMTEPKNSSFYVFLLFAFTYFVNIPRFLVRHGFAEGGNVLRIIFAAWMQFLFLL